MLPPVDGGLACPVQLLHHRHVAAHLAGAVDGAIACPHCGDADSVADSFAGAARGLAKKADDTDDDRTAIIYGSVFGAVGVIGLAYGILVYTGNLSPPRLFRSAGLGYNRAMSEYM